MSNDVISTVEESVNSSEQEKRNKEKSSVLKSLGETIAPITAIIIVLGFIKNGLYYTYFNVPIKYFIGLSEIGMFISDDILKVIFAIASGQIFNLIGSLFSEDKPAVEEAKKEETAETIAKRKKRQGIYKVIGWIAVFATTIFCIIYFDGYIGKIYVYTIIFGALVMYKVVENRNYFITRGYHYYHIIGIYLAIFMCMEIITSSATDIKKTSKGKYNGTIIITEKGSDTSSSKRYFIGKTDKYYIIYNTLDSSADIIPSESVKGFHLKQHEIPE